MSPPQNASDSAVCPVDHKTREAWLQQAKSANASTSPSLPAASTPATQALQTPGCDSSALPQSASSPTPQNPTRLPLGQAREISSIPRAFPTSSPAAAAPANSERDTGSDKKTGNWIYPSEQMFFDAMKRKAYSPEEADMRTIVPIHNAVNERAWGEIKRWESGLGGEACAGPRLLSFSGNATRPTPRAFFNTYVKGYKPPFDRHDWSVDRCGTRVDYVIDFYAGRDEGVPGKDLNFFLDVRPKLNSWEGFRMRVARFWGL